MRKKNLDFLFSSLIAHRGLHGGSVPENSMTAFGAAVRAGYIIELRDFEEKPVFIDFHEITFQIKTGNIEFAI